MLLKDVPFAKGKKSFKVSKEVEELCKKNFTTEEVYSTANFLHVVRKIDKKTLRVKKYFGRACHASNGVSKAEGNVVEAVMTEMCGWKRNCCTEEVTKADILLFATWLVKESVFSRFISNREEDMDEILDTGIILSGDIPQIVLQNICILSRHLKECAKKSFDLFNSAVSKGLSKEAAYNICFNSSISTGQNEKYPFICKGSSHRAYSLLNMDNMLSFATEGPKLPKGFKRYKTFQSYEGVVALYPQSTLLISDLMASDKFKKVLSEYRKKDTSGGVASIPNPFVRDAAPPIRPNQISIVEAENVLIPYLISIGM